MKSILPCLFLGMVMLSSCSTFHYYTVSSQQLRKNEENELVSENDSLRIVYRFTGRQGPVRVTVFNKMNRPLEVDWERSALIIGSQTQPFHRAVYGIEGTTSTVVQPTLTNVRTGEVSGVIEGERPLAFLPPGAFVARQGRTALDGKHSVPDFSKTAWLTLAGEGKYSIRYKKLEYREMDSPLRLRCYLTLRVPGQSGSEFHVDHSFYASEAWYSTASPAMLPLRHQNRGDQFHFLP